MRPDCDPVWVLLLCLKTVSVLVCLGPAAESCLSWSLRVSGLLPSVFCLCLGPADASCLRVLVFKPFCELLPTLIDVQSHIEQEAVSIPAKALSSKE